jgi:hypothetical protein
MMSMISWSRKLTCGRCGRRSLGPLAASGGERRALHHEWSATNVRLRDAARVRLRPGAAAQRLWMSAVAIMELTTTTAH